ncbi:GNAT family N-acetyltransferase [Streptomyces sp. NPDC127051]|uniref:GNAT family N-acetyltransferase n=1 Tax=Streptomyces sp. NPDC127051 TaxID=3347119 RepID=UPI00365DB76C
MDKIASRLETAATPTAPALLLRPWRQADTGDLVEAYRDAALRRWASTTVHDEASAAQWVRDQQRGWETGDRFAFAVVEPGADGADGDEGRVLGQVVLKGAAPGAASAEVGYWTAAPARGRDVAPRALRTLTDWAFASFGGQGLERLELLHQVDNPASCRVAQKCGYALTGILAAEPPAYPHDGHVHVRERGL